MQTCPAGLIGKPSVMSFGVLSLPRCDLTSELWAIVGPVRLAAALDVTSERRPSAC